MNFTNHIINDIEILLEGATIEICDEELLSYCELKMPEVNVSYDRTRGCLNSNLAFKLFTYLMMNCCKITIEEVAILIVEKASTPKYKMVMEKGFINIDVDDSVINHEIEKISKKVNLNSFLKEPFIDNKSIYLLYTKLKGGIEYLWCKGNTVKPSSDSKSKNLALHSLFLYYKKKKSKYEIESYVSDFSEYDYERVSAEVPYDLYVVCFGILTFDWK